MMVCKRKLNINAYKCVCLYNNYYSFLFSPRYPSYPSFNPDTEGILSVMHDLKQKNLSDNTLLSNLDFAERFLRDHPLKNYSKLLVKGNYSSVQIGHSTKMIFIVTSENNQACVDVYIHNIYAKYVTKNCIEAKHFFNHSCQDEFRSCFTQAQEAVNESLSRLHIKCNRFSVTYTSQSDNPGTTVETKCLLQLESLTAEGFMKKKSLAAEREAHMSRFDSMSRLSHKAIPYHKQLSNA